MVQNLKEYFQKKLDEIFADKIEMSLWQDSIWTDIDSYDEDLIFSFDYKKIQEIFPNFGIEHVEFDYIGDDHDGLSSCDTAEVIHFTNINLENKTKDDIDIFCQIMLDGYKKFLESDY